PNSYNTFSSLEEFKVFKDTLLTPEFKEYNMREGHFPGSTLNAFERYLAYKNSVIEDQIHKVDDLNLDQSESYTINDSMSNIVINEEPIEYKTVKKSKTLYKNLRIYPRNINDGSNGHRYGGLYPRFTYTINSCLSATLEESQEMDLLLHVVDASSSDRKEQEQTVLDLMDQLDL